MPNCHQIHRPAPSLLLPISNTGTPIANSPTGPLSPQQIANSIYMVLAADTLEVQNQQEVYHAVVALRNGTGTFEDALIGSLGIWRGRSRTHTFDGKAAQRLHGFALA